MKEARRRTGTLGRTALGGALRLGRLAAPRRESQLGIVDQATVLPTGTHCEQPGRRV